MTTTSLLLPDAAARDAVRTDRDHHLIVAANPGSGKTFLLTEKLLVELEPPAPGAPLVTPDRLVAVTFTRAAAAELRGRLTEGCLQRLRDRPTERAHWTQQLQRLDQAMIGTIDAFVARLLHRYGALGGLPEVPQLVEPARARELALTVALELLQAPELHPGARLLCRNYDFEPAKAIIADALLSVDPIAALWRQSHATLADTATEAVRILAAHEQQLASFLRLAHERFRDVLAERGQADYGRLLLRALELAKQPEVTRAFRRDVTLLAVDEHQDTSELQLLLFMRLLALPTPREAGATRGLFLGDAQQSIYQFRGADITMWRRTEEMVLAAGGQRHDLETTFRTRPALVAALNATVGRILRTPDPTTEGRFDAAAEPMVAVRPELEGAPAPLRFLRAPEKDLATIAATVAGHLAAWLREPAAHPVTEADGTVRPLAPRDIAILSPVLAGVAPAYVDALSAAGIPVRVQGGAGLFARAEVRELSRALRALVVDDPQDVLAWLQGPFGGLTLDELADATDGEPFHVVLERGLRGEGDPRLLMALERRAAWRTLVDQLPHHALATRMFEESGARTYYTRRPDGLLALRNVTRLLELLAAPPLCHQPLWTVARHLRDVIAQRDFEEEAACFADGDDVVTIATIHQAKGLEWPMVILVGQENSITRRNDGDQPAVKPGWGVVLPLAVQPAGDDACLEHGPRWAAFVEEQEAREAAEAKRKLFVAATRARDYLLVAGAFTTARFPRDLMPDTLLSEPGKRMYDTMLRWWRHLGRPALGMQPDATQVVLDGLACPILDPVPVVPLQAPTPIVAERTLPPRQLAPIESALPVRMEITASELMVHDFCPHLHAQSYRDGINLPELDVAGGDATVNRIGPADRGTILHRYLRTAPLGAPEDVRRANMRTAIRQVVPIPEAAMEESLDAMMPHADAVERSPWWARIHAAPVVYRELPLTVPVRERTLLSDKLDVVWQEADGTWYILDFKSLLLRGLEGAAQERALDDRVEAYRLQVAAYATGLAQVLGPDATLGSFVFLFSGLQEAREIPLDPAALAEAQAVVQATVAAIQGPRPADPPVWQPTRCPRCPGRALCAVVAPRETMEEAA